MTTDTSRPTVIDLRPEFARQTAPAVAPREVEPPRKAPPRHGLTALLGDVVAATRAAFAGRPLRAAGSAVEGFDCALCGGTTGHAVYREEIPDARGHDVVQCLSCRLVAVHPMPEPAEIPAFYGETYYGDDKNAKFGWFTELFVLLFRLARVRAIRMMRIRKGHVLDIGCARGLFLRALERVGYTAWGTELSAASALPAQRVLGADRVRVGRLGDCGFEAEQFDAITAWQVFEHLRDPADVLDECHRLLRPGGALLLGVPNIESWQARWSGAEWFHLDVPRHLYHYGPDTLQLMLAKHGFEVERVSHYNLEQNPFGLLQSALHRLGHRHMGLYDLLRAPLEKTRYSMVRRVVRYAAYLAMFPFAAAISYVWSVSGRGATFTVLARRVQKPEA